MNLIDSVLGRYIWQAVSYIECEEQGRILSAAREGKDLVPEFAGKYVSQLAKLDSSILGTLRWVIATYDVSAMAQPVMRDITARLQQGSGELAEVAREYPDWLVDHLRRLLNLAILKLSHMEGV